MCECATDRTSVELSKMAVREACRRLALHSREVEPNEITTLFELTYAYC